MVVMVILMALPFLANMQIPDSAFRLRKADGVSPDLMTELVPDYLSEVPRSPGSITAPTWSLPGGKGSTIGTAWSGTRWKHERLSRVNGGS